MIKWFPRRATADVTRRRVLAAGTATVATGIAAPYVARGAAQHSLRIQTHHPAASLHGKIFQQFVKDVEEGSGGRIGIKGFTSASVVKSFETFDAATTGILDGDMTGAAYITGKDAGFQFFGDLLGGYDSPDQMHAWLDRAGGREIADELYGKFGMHLVGFWGDVTESLVATKPIRNLQDLKDWKFRCPPGMETDIFAQAGAKPVVMAFGEVFTALETGVVDGADAGTLNNNDSLGLYEICKYTTYPGWHSMPQDHLAINKDKWDELAPDLQRLIEFALKKAAMNRMAYSSAANAATAIELEDEGISLIAWPEDEKAKYREIAQEVWAAWGKKSEAAQAAYERHVAFMKRTGVLA